jgi:hypothetical protein
MRTDEVDKRKFVLLVKVGELLLARVLLDLNIHVPEQHGEVIVAREGDLVKVLALPLLDDLFGVQHCFGTVASTIITDGHGHFAHLYVIQSKYLSGKQSVFTAYFHIRGRRGMAGDEQMFEKYK